MRSACFFWPSISILNVVVVVVAVVVVIRVFVLSSRFFGVGFVCVWFLCGGCCVIGFLICFSVVCIGVGLGWFCSLGL